MGDVEKALATQLANIEKRTGKTLAELAAAVRASGLAKHGEVRAMLIERLGLGYGDANTLAHAAKAEAAPAEAGDPLDAIYAGNKAALRPIHDSVMARLERFGAFEIAPKKGYVSLRRKKQFAMIGPGSATRVDVGLNMKDVQATERLLAEKPGSMCQYKVKLTAASEVDAELVGWIRRSYDAAG